MFCCCHHNRLFPVNCAYLHKFARTSAGCFLQLFTDVSFSIYVDRNCGTVLRNAAETRSGKYCIPFVVPLVSFVLFLPCFLTVVPPFWVKCYSRYVVCLFTEPPRTAQQVFNFSCPAKLMSLFSFRSEQWRNQRKESLTCCDFCSSWSQDHLVGTIPMLVPVSLFFFSLFIFENMQKLRSAPDRLYFVLCLVQGPCEFEPLSRWNKDVVRASLLLSLPID